MLQAVSIKRQFVIDSKRYCGYDSRISLRIINTRVLAMDRQASRQVHKLVGKGGKFESDNHLELLQSAAAEAQLIWCVADCSKARNRSALFRAVVKAVDYPQFFGGQFDGLYDCLCDSVDDQKVGLVLLFDRLHSADPGLECDIEELSAVLDDVVAHAADRGKVFIFGFEEVGRHPDDVPGKVHNWSDARE